MEGRTCPPGMTPEQFAEAQRLLEVTKHAFGDELWRMCCLMASKKDGQLFGQTEFELRDVVHRIGAFTLEAAANERRKKGGTPVAALPARTANIMPALSAGGPGQSSVCSGRS
jgi:hypothetical protein